jgi:chromosome partitioning protein
MKIIAIANQKGGVAKTTTALAMGHGLSARGYKTLLVDLDPQGSLTGFLNVDTACRPTVLEFLGIQIKNKAGFEDVKVSISDNLDLIPADISLEEAVGLLIGRQSGSSYLANALRPVAVTYDYCIIDCSPSLSVITWNAFAAADSVIVPIKPEAATLKGVTLLLQSLADAKVSNPRIDVAGFLLTMYDKRRKSTGAAVERLNTIALNNNAPVYTSYIRATASGAAVHGNPFAIAKLPIADDYAAFIDEFLSAQNKNIKENLS